MATQFDNPETITEITAHYTTPGRMIDRTKTFTSVAAYLRWEKSVEAKDYDINCLDTQRKEDDPLLVSEAHGFKLFQLDDTGDFDADFYLESPTCADGLIDDPNFDLGSLLP
jgi:hypothetical protein